MAATKPGNPGNFKTGTSTNKGKALMGRRDPIRTSLGPVRTLFEHMDEFRIPYVAVADRISREGMHRWRAGQRGLSVYTLIEWADALGFDIVAVPRQPAPAVGHTLATPEAVDRTPVSGGTAPGTRRTCRASCMSHKHNAVHRMKRAHAKAMGDAVMSLCERTNDKDKLIRFLVRSIQDGRDIEWVVSQLSFKKGGIPGYYGG